VRVQVNESEPRLRPGMTARVEIEVEERKQALFIPLEAVFERDGRSVVYLEGRRPRAREVVVGPSSADFVVIEKGLARGERVLLRDPGRGAPDTSLAP
jgi:multidrug efflux pump subunit AcrA (membrane-fusion protein)